MFCRLTEYFFSLSILTFQNSFQISFDFIFSKYIMKALISISCVSEILINFLQQLTYCKTVRYHWLDWSTHFKHVFTGLKFLFPLSKKKIYHWSRGNCFHKIICCSFLNIFLSSNKQIKFHFKKNWIILSHDYNV